jgi:O-antigen ligase
LLFLGVAGATILWSREPQATANSVFILCSLVAIYVLVALCPVDREILRRVENGLLLGGLACVGYGLFQLVVFGGFPADPPVPGVTDGRFGNDLLGPNNQAVSLILPLLISLSRSVRAAERSQRVQYTAASALLLGGIVMTGSRGGLLATGVALLVLVAVTDRERGKTRLIAYAVAGAAIAAFIFLTHPFGLAERTVEVDSSSGRTDIWRVGLAACPQYCAFGAGWGTFPEVYADTQASVADARVLVGGGAYEPHNVWVLVGIELGALGVVLLAAGLLLSFAEAWRLPTDLRGPPLSGMAATVFAAAFLSNLEFKFFWMALMIIALSRNLSDDGEAVEPPRGDAVARGPSWV